MRNDTVLFSIRYGFAARNILRTGVLRGLRAAGARVVAAAPAFNEPYLRREAEERGFALVPYPQDRATIFEQVFAATSNVLLFDHPATTPTMRIKWRRLAGEGRWGPFAAKAAASVLGLDRVPYLRRAAERFDSTRFAHPHVGRLIDEIRPSLVVTTDLFSEEARFLREGRRRAIPTVAVVKSWDNLTSKTRIRVEPDFYVVWSPLMADELRRLHFVDPARVFVAGATNFDLFAGGGFTPRPRADFLRSLGVDVHRKLVVYSPGAKATFHDDDNIRTLHAALTALEPEFPFHLHIRKYPKSAQRFDHLQLPHTSVGEAGVVVPSWADNVDQQAEHMEFLGELMYHADLVVHVGSTVAIDAGCFDTPIIGYALDARAGRSRWHLAPWVFDLTHMRYLTDLGGQRVVCTPDELQQEIRAYFRDPARDREGRRRMVDAICGAFDGQAGDRIASFLLAVMRGEGREAVSHGLAGREADAAGERA